MLIPAVILLLTSRQHLAEALTVQRYRPTQHQTNIFSRSQHQLHLGNSAASSNNKPEGKKAFDTKLRQSQRGNVGGSRTSANDESWWSPSEGQSSRLNIRRRVRSVFQSARNRRSSTSSSLHQSSNNNNNAEKTWSKPSQKSSSLGVRRRVKAVLKKARSRTGVSNGSEESAANGLWIAEAASIGGLGLAEDSDFLLSSSSTSNTDEKNGFVKSNGVAADNGASAITNGATATAATNGATATTNGATTTGAYASTTRAPARVGVVRKASNSSEIDGLRADVPTALPEPLPFKLPVLSKEQERLLAAGERIQEQSKMGREGSGYVVVDVKAPAYVLWECLLDFEGYPGLIKTVRAMEMFTSNKLKSGYHAEKPVPKGSNRELRHYGIPSVTRAAFILSKFKLNIAAIHNYRPHPDGHYMVFNLDPECTNVVLKSATGIWHAQSKIDENGEEYTRVWLLCELKVSQLLPKFIVDYTAQRAMPRATSWLKPHVEDLAVKWAEEHQYMQ